MDSSSSDQVQKKMKEKMMEETSGEALTEELVDEILLRLPVKSLMRFMSVCKRWYSLIISPNFISTHSDRSNKKNVSVWLSRYDYTDDTPHAPGPSTMHVTPITTFLTFVFGQDLAEEYIRLQVFYPLGERLLRTADIVVGCTKGVVCLSLSGLPQSYALWNPATKQVRQIGGAPMDDPRARYLDDSGERFLGCYGSGICFDPSTHSFVVVQIALSLTAEGTSVRVNVFSTATDTWTEKNTAALPYWFKFRGLYSTPSICANGWMHWLAPLFHPSPNTSWMHVRCTWGYPLFVGFHKHSSEYL